MTEICVIHNTHANKNRKGVIDASKLGTIVGTKGLVRQTHSTDELTDIVRYCYHKDVPLIIFNGGDGTLQAGITELIRGYDSLNKQAQEHKPLPRVALLPGGTVNCFARTIGASPHIYRGLERIVAGNYELAETPALRISTNAANETNTANATNATDVIDTINTQEEYGFVFATGIIASFLEEYYNKESGETSVMKALMMIMKGAGSLILKTAYAGRIAKPVSLRLNMSGCESAGEREYTAMLATTIPCEIGLGLFALKPLKFMATMTEEDRGWYGECIYSAVTSESASKLIRALPRIITGKPIEGIDYSTEPYLSMNSPEKWQYTIDGELRRTTQLSITPGPKIKVIRW